MNKNQDPVGRVADDGPITFVLVVCALGGALMFGLLLSWEQFASVASKDLGVLRVAVMALVGMAVLMLLAYVVRVLLAIWPRREKKS